VDGDGGAAGRDARRSYGAVGHGTRRGPGAARAQTRLPDTRQRLEMPGAGGRPERDAARRARAHDPMRSDARSDEGAASPSRSPPPRCPYSHTPRVATPPEAVPRPGACRARRVASRPDRVRCGVGYVGGNGATASRDSRHHSPHPHGGPARATRRGGGPESRERPQEKFRFTLARASQRQTAMLPKKLPLTHSVSERRVSSHEIRLSRRTARPARSYRGVGGDVLGARHWPPPRTLYRFSLKRLPSPGRCAPPQSTRREVPSLHAIAHPSQLCPPLERTINWR
jgi:hypothetical protein